MIDYTPYMPGIRALVIRKGVNLDEPISMAAVFKINYILDALEETLYFYELHREILYEIPLSLYRTKKMRFEKEDNH